MALLALAFVHASTGPVTLRQCRQLSYTAYEMKLLSLVLLSFTLSGPVLAADAVPDAATAEKIGAVALKAKLGEYTYEKYMQTLTWAAMLNGDYWFAMPVLQPKPEPDLKELQGWTIQIDRHDGRVIGVYLQY